jgi:hypothetical protein
MSYAVIRYYYTHSEIQSLGLNENKLRFYWYDTNSSSWEALDPDIMSWVYGVGLNKDDNYVWAIVTHFSDYVVGELQGEETNMTLMLGWNLISLPLGLQ